MHQVSYACDVSGDWTVCAWWEGDQSHTSAYSENLSLTVVEAEEEPPPPEEGIPTEYIYALVAVIAIIIIAAAAYVYMKRGK